MTRQAQGAPQPPRSASLREAILYSPACRNRTSSTARAPSFPRGAVKRKLTWRIRPVRRKWALLGYRILRIGHFLHAISALGEMSAGASTLCVMVREIPSTLRYLAGNQSGVVSRSQALRAGLSPGMIKFRVSSGRWRQIYPGVYATFDGQPTHRTRLWAALLSAGPGATLSHETAAELHQLADERARLIHVTVPVTRRVTAVEGVCLHRSARAVQAAQAGSRPPRTRIEETVLDLAHAAKTFDDVCGWVTRAIARELTDETRLRAAMEEEKDNPTAAGQQSLRYGWAQVRWAPCATAAEVARVLRRHGWDGRPRPCSPGCPVQQDFPARTGQPQFMSRDRSDRGRPGSC